jgi:hypothetical protein
MQLWPTFKCPDVNTNTVHTMIYNTTAAICSLLVGNEYHQALTAVATKIIHAQCNCVLHHVKYCVNMVPYTANQFAFLYQVYVKSGSTINCQEKMS